MMQKDDDDHELSNPALYFVHSLSIVMFSLAVDSAEPHISNLMDDLETIQIEKEKLQKEKTSMERKVQNIIEEANAQRHHHSSEQENLTKRLKELEVGIRYTFLSLNVMTAHMKRIIIPDTALFLSLRVSLSPSIHHPSATISKQIETAVYLRIGAQ